MPEKKHSEMSLISIVVPAYKAEKFIGKNLQHIKEVLDQTRYNYEIICVVDGMMDKTYDVASKVAAKYPDKIKVVGYLTNLGKGHAVRYGMAKAKGNTVGFIDAGGDLNPNGISILLEHFQWYEADIIIGSKRHPASKVTYPWQRKIISIVYQIIVKVLFGLNVRDTQVGIKFFRREVLEKVMPRLVVKAFAFDIEFLAVANYLGFKKIYEAPIELTMNFDDGVSTIIGKKFLTITMATLWDTLAVFYRLRIRHFYDNKNRSKWYTPEYLKISGK